MLSFAEKWALITGAGSGLGAAMARVLSAERCNLILTGRNVDALEKTAAECKEISPIRTYITALDLEDTSSIDKFYQFVKDNGLKIDLFVLNAGISQRAKTLDTHFDVDKKIFQTDILGNVYLIKRFSEELKQAEHTSIAVTSSLAGLFAFPLRSAYCGAKSALIGFFETIGLEYENIDVTILIPGRVKTEISRSALLEDGKAYGKIDEGQAKGISAEKAARKAVRAIRRRKHRVLIGGAELLMAYIQRFIPALYYKLAAKISPT